MIAQKKYEGELNAQATAAPMASTRFSDYKELFKVRLSMLVVFSTFIGFLLGSHDGVNWTQLIIVCFGGFLVVGAANGINQIIEKDSDRLMLRTENRPLAQGRLSVSEAALFCLIVGSIGVLLIGYFLNPLCALLIADFPLPVRICLYTAEKDQPHSRPHRSLARCYFAPGGICRSRR